MSDDFHDQTIALSSMFQSATLISKLAKGEAINQAAFDCSLDSLFTLDAKSINDIYGYGDGLVIGLKNMLSYLSGITQSPDKLIAYYVLSLLKVQSRLINDQKMVEKVQQGLKNIDQQVADFDLPSSSRILKVDGLYQDTISHIKPRIMVQGDQTHLSNNETTAKVRVLLFAGIRAAVLWQQRGGSRLKLLFLRKKYIHKVESILDKL